MIQCVVSWFVSIGHVENSKNGVTRTRRTVETDDATTVDDDFVLRRERDARAGC